MINASEDIKKSSRGRPRTDTSPVMVRMSAAELVEVDGWIAGQGPPFVTRPEAVRRLVTNGLKGVGNPDTLPSNDVHIADAIPQPTPPPIVMSEPAPALEPAPLPAYELLTPQLPPLEIPATMREKLAEYRDSRPWFGSDDDAILDLIQRGLELAEGRDDLVELDEDQVRQLRQLHPDAELGPIISRWVAMGIRTAILSREEDE